MTTPFELADLVNKLKSQGLEIGEEAAKIATKAVLEWLKDSVILTDNKWDDFFLAVEPLIEAELLKMADKINPAD